MHGFDLMRRILTQAHQFAWQAQITKVSSILVAAGAKSGHSAAELHFAFDNLRVATVCRNAQLDIETVTGSDVELVAVEGR